MARRRNKALGGIGGSFVSGGWGLYSTVTTARDLPDDAGWAAQMIADPPVYAPWLLFVVCVVFLGWVFWDRSEDEGDSPERPTTSGPNSPIIGGSAIGSAIGEGAKVVGSDNRKGFFNDRSVIQAPQVYNEKPSPEFVITEHSRWCERGDEYIMTIEFVIKNGTGAEIVDFLAECDGLRAINVGPVRTGSPVLENSVKDGKANIVFRYQPNITIIALISTKPVKVRTGLLLK